MKYGSALNAALLLGGTALAGTFPYSQSSCTIYYSTVSVSDVRTFHHTTKTTITPTIIVTSARTRTTTPKPTTFTTTLIETETETSTVQSMDTFTDTTTEVTTVTVTQPIATETETSTQTFTTTSTTTEVVPSTSGFTPVRSSLPNADYDGADGGPPPSKRSITESSIAAEAQHVEERAAGQHVLHHHKYPQSVECTKIRTKSAPAVTSTRTRGKISTVTAPTPTTTTTSETKTTVTSTTVLTAHTTTTTTTTSSVSSTRDQSTTTETSTTTQTNTEVATATAYEQCMYNNFADELNGHYGMYLLASQQTYSASNIGGVTNALDCCASCASSPNCAVSIYTSMSGGCYNLNNCGADFPAMQSDNYDWVVNNGCGTAF